MAGEKKPLTPFFAFCADQRENHKGDDKLTAKVLGERWRDLGEKGQGKWKDAYVKEKAAWDEEQEEKKENRDEEEEKPKAKGKKTDHQAKKGK